MLEEFGKSIDVLNSKVIGPPLRIFLCGGPMVSVEGRESQRSRFLQFLAARESPLHQYMILAERLFQAPNTQDLFSDLLEFETYLGHLSAYTLIFVESPGSLAELGAFALLDSVSRRVYAVTDREYHPRNSFVSQGPLKRLERIHEDRIHVFEGLTGNGPELDDDDFEEIASVFERLIKAGGRQQRPMGLQDDGDVMLLLVDVVARLPFLKKAEIQKVLSSAGAEIDDARLGKMLATLGAAGVIQAERYSHNIFFVRGEAERCTKIAFFSNSRLGSLGAVESEYRQAILERDEKRRKGYRRWARRGAFASPAEGVA